jgi:hypothetical protein
MSPKNTEWSAIYDVHYGRGRSRQRGLKVVELGGFVDHHHAVKAAEHREEARHGTVKIVLEKRYAHTMASVMSAVDHVPIWT